MAKFENDILTPEEELLAYDGSETDIDVFSLGENDPYPIDLPDFSESANELESDDELDEVNELETEVDDNLEDDSLEDDTLDEIEEEPELEDNEIDISDDNLDTVWDSFDEEEVDDDINFDDDDDIEIEELEEDKEEEVDDFLTDIMDEDTDLSEDLDTNLSQLEAEKDDELIKKTFIQDKEEVDESSKIAEEDKSDLLNFVKEQEEKSIEAKKEIENEEPEEIEEDLGVIEKEIAPTGNTFTISMNDVFADEEEQSKSEKTQKKSKLKKKKKKKVGLIAASIILLLLIGASSLFFFGDKIGIDVKQKLVSMLTNDSTNVEKDSLAEKSNQITEDSIPSEKVTKEVTEEVNEIEDSISENNNSIAQDIEEEIEEPSFSEKEDNYQTETKKIYNKPKVKKSYSEKVDRGNTVIKHTYSPNSLSYKEEIILVEKNGDKVKFQNPATNELATKKENKTIVKKKIIEVKKKENKQNKKDIINKKKQQKEDVSVISNEKSYDSETFSKAPNKQAEVSKPPVKTNKGIFSVQVYSSLSREDANDRVRKLRQMNVPNVWISEYQKRDVTWYRVRFGNFKSLEEARKQSKKFGFTNTWIDRIK